MASKELPQHLNPQQLAAATAPADLPLLVVASAGTGKTSVLTARVLHLVERGVNPSHILVLVFTRQAAREAEERLRGRGVNVRAQTFHSLGLAAVRRYHKVLGYTKQPTVVSRDEDVKIRVEQALRMVGLARLLEDACRWLGMPLQGATWDAVAAEARAAHPALYEACWRAAFEAPANDQQQRDGSQAPGPPDNSQESAQTPADLAGVEAAPAKRARPLQTDASGSQQLEPRALRFGAEEDEGDGAAAPLPPPPPLPPLGTPLSTLKFGPRVRAIELLFLGMARALGGEGEADAAEVAVRPPAKAAAARPAVVREHLDFISKAKSRGHAPGQYRGVPAAVYEAYQAGLLAAAEVDFNDMLILLHRLLTEFPHVLDDMRARHRYILVDECQDLNALQVAVTVALAGPAARLTAVGDDAQSIYAFRGAEAWTMDAIREIHVGANPDLRKALTINYRSRQRILDAARAVLGPQAKELVAASGEAGEPVTLVEAATQAEEAEWVRRRVQALAAGGVPYREMAVLFRCRRTLGASVYGPVKAALDAAGVPNKLLAERTLLDRAVVKDLRAYLALVLDPHNDDAFAQVVNRPRRGVGAGAVAALRRAQAASALRASLHDCATAAAAAGRDGGAASGLLPAQLAGLRGFLRTLAALRRAALARDPVELVAHLLRRTRYVEWAEAERARKKGGSGEGVDLHAPDVAMAGSDAETDSCDGSDDEEAEAEAEAVEDGDSGNEEEEEEEEAEEEEEDYAGLDPLTPYRLNLSGFGAATGPLRRVLRQAALFTATYPLADAPIASPAGERLGPPSLLELSWKAAARSGDAATRREVQESDEMQEWAARVRLGPRVLSDFVSHVWEEGEGGDSTLDEDNVVLSTIHGAKGLEWDAVFLIRFNDGSLPMGYWDSGTGGGPAPPERPLIPGYVPPAVGDPQVAHLAEERRLAHVALTRARHHLVVTLTRYSAVHTRNGPGHRLENPSPLVADLIAECCGPERGDGVRVERLPESNRERAAARGAFVPRWAPHMETHPHSVWEAARTPEGREMLRRTVAGEL